MGGSEGDWRLTNQESYLQGVTLIRKPYTAYSETWEHDHCSFCWAKFMDANDPERDPEALSEGYATTAEHASGADYHWVCPACFDDFVELFGWHVAE